MHRLLLTSGAVYVAIIVLGIGGEVVFRAPLLGETAAGTTGNIAAAPSLLTLSILTDALMIACDVALTALLAVLLAPVSLTLTALIVAFRLMQAAILGGNLLLLQRARLGPADGLHDALLSHAYGYDLGLLFFGVATVLTALTLRLWGALPKWLAPLLGAAGMVYLVGSLLRIVAPDWHAAFAPAYIVPVVAETAFALLLLRAGLNARRGGLTGVPAL